MADVNKSVEVKFVTNADQVKSEVDGLLSSLDKTSNEYEELERSLRDVVNAEQKLIQSEQKLNEELGRTKGATASIEAEVRKNTVAYQNKVRELDNVRQRYSQVDESSQRLNNSTQRLTSSISSNGGAMGLLGEVFGPIPMIFKDASESTELFGNKLSGLKGALVASGIGLAVIIVAELIANWDKWSSAIDGSTQKLKDLNLELNITKSLNAEAFEQMSTDLKLMEARGATEQEILDYKKKNRDEYVRLLNEEYQKELDIYKQSKDNSLEAQKAINDKRDAVGVKIREYDAELQIAQILINKKKTEEETNKEIERKKKAQDEYNKGLLSAQQIANQSKTDNLKNSQTEYEILKEKYEKDLALLKQYGIDATQLEIKYMNDVNNLKLKDGEAEKKRNEDRLKSLKDLLDKSRQKELEYKDLKTAEEVEEFRLKQENIITNAENERILKATELGATEEQLKQIRDYYDSLRVDNNKNATDTIKNQEDVLFNFRMDLWNKIGGAIGALGGLFKQHTAASKILALSEIAIGTATGFINALRIAQESARGPGAAFAFPIFYASQVTAVLGAVARAKAVLSSGGSGGSGSAASPSIPASAAPNVSFVSSNENQVASSIARTTGEQPPLRAYVVSGDVTTAQSLDRNLVNNSSLG